MKILIPMAGNGQRFKDAGYEKSKPFIDVLGKPMIERVVENLGGEAAGDYIFVIQSPSWKDNPIPYLRALVRDCEIVTVPEPTAGAACTALLAREHITRDSLLIANCDQIIAGGVRSPSPDQFIDGAIFTFAASNSKWSYAAVDDTGRVWGVAEKQPISQRATCGIYWWRVGTDFVRAADRMIEKNVRVNNEFYIAPVFNELIRNGAYIQELPVTDMWGLGTPDDLRQYIKTFTIPS